MLSLEVWQGFLKDHKELVEFALKVVSGLVFLGGAAVGLARHLFEKHWRRRQFAHDYAERIVEHPDVRLAMMMLDWSKKTMSAEDAMRLGCQPFQWNAAMVAKALDDHDHRPDGAFLPEEYAIRTVFDAFVARFERLGDFVDCGIIGVEDFPGTLSYYISLMNEKRLDPIRPKLSRYMARYGSPKARKLFATLGAKDFGEPFRLRRSWRSRWAGRRGGLPRRLPPP